MVAVVVVVVVVAVVVVVVVVVVVIVVVAVQEVVVVAVTVTGMALPPRYFSESPSALADREPDLAGSVRTFILLPPLS